MQSQRDLLDRGRIGGIAASLLWCPTVPRAWYPNQGLRLNARHIDLLQLRDARAQLGVMAVAGIQQHQVTRQTHLTCPADMLESDLRFGLEADLFRHSRFVSTDLVLSPVFWQIQLISHRQARSVIGNRQRHRHLAVRLLAKLPAILVRYPDPVVPL